MGEQDIQESLRIARREHQLAVERHDDASADILERAIVDLERHVVQLPEALQLPRPRTAGGRTSESDEAS